MWYLDGRKPERVQRHWCHTCCSSVSGLIYPPIVAKGEESAGPWQRLFDRAKQAGLDLDALRGVTSDGAKGLLACLRQRMKNSTGCLCTRLTTRRYVAALGGQLEIVAVVDGKRIHLSQGA